MPVTQGAFRKAIDDFMETNPATTKAIEYKDTIGGRADYFQQLYAALLEQEGELAFGQHVGLRAQGLGWALTGWDFWVEDLRRRVGVDAPGFDLSQEIADKLRGVFSQPAAREIAEALGAVVTEPVLSIFEQYAGRDDIDPHEFSRAFHGFMIGLNVSGGLADIVLETATAGQVEGVGRMLQSVYWSLGLGFLGWQTLAPLLSAGLQPSLEAYYNRLYRPKRFSAGELRDLYALGEIGQAEVEEEARRLGWRDRDITQWLRLAFRNLGEADVWALYKKGELTREQVVERLRALGFDPDDIPLLFVVNAEEEADDATIVTKSTARRAYREHLISESELRELLAAANVAASEIDLIVAIENQTLMTQRRALTVSQIKAAWVENRLVDAEVRHYLGEEGFGEHEIDILLDTWQLEIEPEFVKLNRGTIVNAYVAGVLNREQARLKLMSVGLSDEDAALELDLAEARNPEQFGLPAPPTPRTLTAGAVADLMQSGLISPDEMQERLVALGYSEEDASLLTQAAVLKAEEETRPLSVGVLTAAYVNLVIDRERFIDELVGLDYTPDDAELLVDTVEADYPTVFFPESIQAIRLPSTGAIAEALRSHIINDSEYYDRMFELGYDKAGADLYRALVVNQERKGSRKLSATQIANAYEQDIFSWGEALIRLGGLGYSDDDAKVLLKLNKKVLQDTDVWEAFLAGLVPLEQTIMQLIAQGYTEEEIDDAFRELAPEAVESEL